MAGYVPVMHPMRALQVRSPQLCIKMHFAVLRSLAHGASADLLPLLSSVRSMSLMEGSGGSASTIASPPLGMRGHYIDTKPGHRRMTAVGSNQNKAITKRLASAGHYQQVCCLGRGPFMLCML